ncbi:flagellar export chaperone FliS [Lederbergia lenta]|uniref:Flagellar protein FliS n=1 Tax=Lederbergia lenta TaxID=1467 RepID=A0A2X4WGP7_LEDLE|nr:flagellar export chaperone FliS [Lederbergia lenta]MEC2322905.1 flagellar export chaperone FliS [Lederbergia lenta]SQI62009.1 flagellar protein FliS [Lederbergia lenta]
MDFLTKELIYQMTPQKITALLYEVCINHLQDAIQDIEQNQPLEANVKLQKVNDILERLGAGINYEAGIVADQLDTLYNYMANQVIIGNLKKDKAILEEVLNICEQLASAWNEAMNTGETQSQRLHQQRTNAYEQNVMVLDRE